jgi:hypothetical protein
MVACVGGRGDGCPRCGSKKYEYIRSLTREEKVKLERDVREFQRGIFRKRKKRPEFYFGKGNARLLKQKP